MKVFMGTDIEGVAGVVSFEAQSRAEARYYDNAQKLLTAEINAAVEGLLDAGAEEILVNDGHGPGAVWFEDLHPRARLIHGRPTAPRQRRDPYIAACDVCVMIGQHAMAGIETSNQNHTQNSRSVDYYKLNGKVIGEIAQFALYQGDLGLPFIFLSGERDACLEAEALAPGVRTVCVKEGLGRGAAISLAAVRARDLIREGIAAALKAHRHQPLLPLVWNGPFELEKRFFTTQDADAVAQQPGVERVDGQTVRLRGENIRDLIYR
jgi:D-amino peptidase